MIERLYAAFAKLDGDAMHACYGAQAKFDDGVFTLNGAREIGGMWRMLCDTAKAQGGDSWRLEVRDITERSAHWEAHYVFPATGRQVHNIVDASFDFDKRGLIASHRDRFDFWVWSRQALGLTGWLLGWTPYLRDKVRTGARANLQRSLARR